MPSETTVFLEKEAISDWICNYFCDMKAVISVIQLKRTVKKKAYPFGQSINGFIPPAEDDQARHKPISVILKDLHK